MHLKQALQNIGIKTHFAPNNEFAIACVFCGDHEHHLHINEAKQRYFCYRRGCKGHTNTIIKHFGLSLDLKESTETSTLEKLKKRFSDITLKPVQDKAIPPVSLDLSKYQPLGHTKSLLASKAKQYVLNRGFTEEQIKQYDLRIGSGEHTGRIIIPFYEHQNCVYFQARAYMMSPVKKVRNPTKQDITDGKSKWLFGFDQAQAYEQVVVCEGWASAMSAGLNAVAISGTALSTTQLKKLICNWNDFVILLDYKAENAAIKIACELRLFKPYAKIQIGLLPYGDPNEITALELDDCLNDLKPFETIQDRYNISTQTYLSK